ncbi:MAG: ACT domain-containing protein [Opitutae bacterium]|nr:ACT domain-containing protein [Opitutae bacterium]
MNSQAFSILRGEWAIAQLAPDAPLPNWATVPAPFLSITRTATELSIVAPAAAVPADVRAERGWALLKLQGPFAFNQTGILASFAAPLADAGIGLFALSTFDTDYLLVKTTQAPAAVAALLAAGHPQK